MRSLRAVPGAGIGLALVLGVLACAYRQAPFLDYSPGRGVDLPAPPSDRAQVIFFLRVATDRENLVLYHDGERFGVLRYVTWTSRLVEPGEHRFGVVGSESADFTVGRLEGGRSYLLEAQNVFPTSRYRLEPVGPWETHTGMTVGELMAGLLHVQPNGEFDAWLRQHGPRYQELYDRYLAKWSTRPESQRRRIEPDLALEGPVRFVRESR